MRLVLKTRPHAVGKIDACVSRTHCMRNLAGIGHFVQQELLDNVPVALGSIMRSTSKISPFTRSLVGAHVSHFFLCFSVWCVGFNFTR